MENGKTRREKDMECNNGVMDLSTKATGTMTKPMEEAN